MKRLIGILLCAAAFCVQAQNNNINILGSTTGTFGDGNVKPVLVDSTGRLITTVSGTGTSSVTVQGTAADGSAVIGNPVQVGGYDGTNQQTFLTDTSGRQITVGAAATGAAVTGNPVLVGGSDGTNAQPLKTDTSGRQIAVGGAANGATVAGAPLLMAGADSGAVTRTLRTDSAGVQQVTPFLSGTAVYAFSGNVANSTATATLSNTASVVNYLTGFMVTASGSTAALVVNGTITGLAGGTMTFTFVFPAGVTVAATPLIVNFPVPLQASAANTAIVITVPAGGAGNTNAAVSIFGFKV